MKFEVRATIEADMLSVEHDMALHQERIEVACPSLICAGGFEISYVCQNDVEQWDVLANLNRTWPTIDSTLVEAPRGCLLCGLEILPVSS